VLVRFSDAMEKKKKKKAQQFQDIQKAWGK
jgi:hypothetical protein